MTTSSADATGSTNGILNRTARHAGQLWQVPVFLLGAVALGTVAAASSFVPGAVEDPVDHDLAMVRRASKNPAFLAQTLWLWRNAPQAAPAVSPNTQVKSDFLAGAVCLRLAERSAPERAA